MNMLYISCALALVVMFCHTSVAGCPGCPIDADPNDETVKTYAEKSIEEIQKEINAPYKLNLIKIENVTTQVVAGQLLRYHLIVGYQDPKSNKMVNYKCKVKVWLKPWQNFEEITVNNCVNIGE